MSAVISSSSDDQIGTTSNNKPRSKLARWYRTPLFNVILVGLISFTQPGIWNALNSTYQIPIPTYGREWQFADTKSFFSPTQQASVPVASKSHTWSTPPMP